MRATHGKPLLASAFLLALVLGATSCSSPTSTSARIGAGYNTSNSAGQSGVGAVSEFAGSIAGSDGTPAGIAAQETEEQELINSK